MPFGLKNAAQTFQRLMDKLFATLPFVYVYLDDILIASKSEDEHVRHLRAVFEVLTSNGLHVNVDKCKFAVTQVEFLGHLVSSTGVRPLTSHLEAIQSFPAPVTVRDLQKFLGLLNFYRRFVPRAAQLLKPLTDALGGKKKTLQWGEDQQLAFEEAKKAIARIAELTHPDPAAPVSLATDASSSHVGAVLQQWQRHHWRPLAFFSRKLSKAEVNYSTFDRELLAAFLAVKQFRFQLEGRRFKLFTDHKPLVAAT
jgi:hypothetical protein